MQNFVEENKLQHGERESPKLRGGKLGFNFIALSLVYFVWNQLTYTTIPKQIVKWNWTRGKIEPQQNVFPQGVIDREQNAVADSLLDDFKNKDSQSLKTTIKWFFMLLFMNVFFLQ